MSGDRPWGFHRHELGVWVPDGVEIGRPPSLPAVNAYLTYSELAGGREMTREDLVGRLRRLSAEDCLLQIARIGARLYANPRPSHLLGLQRSLVLELSGEGAFSEVVLGALEDGRWRAVYFEQQLVHLARLVLLYADPRPHDDFASGALYDEWMTCLIGVTDLLDAGLQIERRDDRLAWELRQYELNQHVDPLPDTAIHYEIYRVLWPELDDVTSRAAAEAFGRSTGMEIGDYFSVGAAVVAQLHVHAGKPGGSPFVRPEDYFSSVKIDPAVWKAFFALTARRLPELRDALLAEEAQYGPTTYGALTFERYPLLEVERGLYLPLSVWSLQRRMTQGVFHILGEIAETEGRDRRTYASAFGPAFQTLVERTMRRGEDAVPITADVEYGPRTARRRSSDVIVAYDRNPVFVEVVSGPLQAATGTRGDLVTFAADARRLVVGKARQLDRSIADFLAGDFSVDGADPANVDAVWPVILTSHTFPHTDTVSDEVERLVREAGHLQGDRIGPLAIVSAEELHFCEGFMAQGRTFLSLIRSWKSSEDAQRSFKNHLVSLGGGRAPGSAHFQARYNEATEDFVRRLLRRPD